MVFHRVAATISVIGCGFLIFTIWLFRRYTAFNQRMILCIGLCGAGGAIANIAGENPEPGFCRTIAFVNTLFDWAMLLWVCAVAIRLYLAIFWEIVTERFERAYHIIIWPLALVIGILPFMFDKYGNSGVWCWIVPDVNWRMGIWYGPMVCVVVILVGLYLSIIVKLRSRKDLFRLVLPLLFYPFVYILLYIIPLANRIQNYIDPDNPDFGLVAMAAVSAASLGAANALVYGLDRETRRKLRWAKFKSAWTSRFTPSETGEGCPGSRSRSGNSQTAPKTAYSISLSSGASQTEVKQLYSIEISTETDGPHPVIRHGLHFCSIPSPPEYTPPARPITTTPGSVHPITATSGSAALKPPTQQVKSGKVVRFDLSDDSNEDPENNNIMLCDVEVLLNVSRLLLDIAKTDEECSKNHTLESNRAETVSCTGSSSEINIHPISLD